MWELAQAGLPLGWFSALRPEAVANGLQYGPWLLALLFLHLSRVFLRLPGAGWRWWLFGGAWGAARLGLDLARPRLPDPLWAGGGWEIGHSDLSFALSVVGWGVLLSGATWLTLNAYRRSAQPLHRNRIKYWVLALGLTVLGYALHFAGQAALSSGLRAAGSGAAAAVTLVHQLPDVRGMARQALVYLSVVVLLALILYAANSVSARYLVPAAPTYGPALSAAALAILLAVLFDPLRNLARGLAGRLISGAGYNPAQIVREYSQGISHIVDLDQLAQVVLSSVADLLGTRRGALFLVDPPAPPDSPATFEVQPVRALGVAALGPGSLAAEGPVARRLSQEPQPLTQYDIDLLPRFRAAAASERIWLAGLAMDVYVPIYSKGRWIGLLALGPKVSRDRYFESDLALLRTLADQTTIALENARLVENLGRLNRDLQQASAALEQANQNLTMLDRAKSDFIDNMAHELRTPLSVILGYSQFLQTAPEIKANAQYQQMVGALQRSAARLGEIVNTMLDVSMLETRTFELDFKPTSLAALMRSLGARYEKPLAERRLTLDLRQDLDDLPEVQADEEALGKAFDNLLVNAIQYTPDGGRITVSGHSRRGSPESVEVIISDTGIGVDPQQQALIFTKFFQTGKVDLQPTGKTRFKAGGPGLGLTIAQGIVEAHGGKLWVESPGHDEEACPGSRFHAVLPVRRSG